MLAPGTRIGPYEISAFLGAGAMGQVYKARDLKLDRDVALKLLPADLVTDSDRLRRFEQEARSASALNHPAIVAIYELGHAGGRPYISMELVEGQTLRQVLDRAPIPARRALHIGAQISEALAKAHAAGIVHRDLKPENLMVSPDGHVKILDFGLAKLAGGTVGGTDLGTMTHHGTRDGIVLGTVGYMSPEQASGQAVDSRSDQFSFGVVLYEMLTGRRAFAKATPVETLSAIIGEDPPSLESRVVPPPIRWIVERCLAKAPEDRYVSTRDLARDLSSAHEHFSELSTTSAIGPPRSPVRRREAIAWTLIALLGTSVLGLALRQSSGRSAEPVHPIRFTIAAPQDSSFHLTVGMTPFALSPDGRHLAFVAVVDGGRQLWLRSFDSLESRRLPGTEGATSPFWSPDGLSLGFFAQNKLKRIPRGGGDAVTICDTLGGGGATWNREGVILFAPSVDSGLYQVSAGGGTATQVTVLDASHDEAAHLSPVFLPDGRRFVFAVLGRDNAGVHAGSLDGSERKLLLRGISSLGFGEPDRLFFVRSRNLMAQQLDLTRLETIGDPILVAEGVATQGPSSAMAVSASGAVVHWSGSQNITQLTWVRRDGKAVGTVGPPGGYMNIGLSPDGRQVAVDRFDTEPAVWLFDVARGSVTRATFGGRYESTPVWAPDGRSLVFAAARDTPPNLYLKRLDDTGGDRRLFRTTIQCFPQSWSRDGQFIAYVTVDPKTHRDIWVVPTAGDQKPSPVIETPFDEDHPRISPDGRWLAYVSNETGRNAVYVTRFPRPAGKWPVSTDGGSFPVWRADSRELFYRAPHGRFMAVAIGAGQEFEAAAPVYLFTPRAVPGTLGMGTFYDVSADGRFLINALVDQTNPPATIVLNWAASIRPF